MSTNKGARRLSPQTMRQLNAAGYTHFGTGAEKWADGVKYILVRRPNGGWRAGHPNRLENHTSVAEAIAAVDWEIARIRAIVARADASKPGQTSLDIDWEEGSARWGSIEPGDLDSILAFAESLIGKPDTIT